MHLQNPERWALFPDHGSVSNSSCSSPVKTYAQASQEWLHRKWSLSWQQCWTGSLDTRDIFFRTLMMGIDGICLHSAEAAAALGEREERKHRSRPQGTYAKGPRSLEKYPVLYCLKCSLSCRTLYWFVCCSHSCTTESLWVHEPAIFYTSVFKCFVGPRDEWLFTLGDYGSIVMMELCCSILTSERRERQYEHLL